MPRFTALVLNVAPAGGSRLNSSPTDAAFSPADNPDLQASSQEANWT